MSTVPAGESGNRLAFIDALKAIASQLIVLHHLAFYGPLSEAAHRAAPGLVEWLARDARMAVQAFLVIGGFLAARALAPGGLLLGGPAWPLVGRRYLKLVLPYAAAVLLSVLMAALVRPWLLDDVVPPAPTLAQFLAHLTLLHSVLGFDSLSTGVWYVAIDFQLFALLLALLAMARSCSDDAHTARRIALALIIAGCVASLFHFNRHDEWDAWALYFFGSYGLGALAYWASERETSSGGLLALGAITGLALMIEFRDRIVLSLAVTLALGFARRWDFLPFPPNSAVLAWLGKISYSLFLSHFAVVLAANAIFAQIRPDHPAAGLAGIFLAWMASIGLGALFHQQVESRCAKRLATFAPGRRRLA